MTGDGQVVGQAERAPLAYDRLRSRRSPAMLPNIKLAWPGALPVQHGLSCQHSGPNRQKGLVQGRRKRQGVFGAEQFCAYSMGPASCLARVRPPELWLARGA